jgi:hypothetical protein
MKRLFAFVSCACLCAFPVSAHHSLAAYNLSTSKTVEGTVKTFEYTNPHAKLTLMVTGADGHTLAWDFEGGSVGRLSSGGMKKDTIAPGDKIKVAYNPRRDNGVGGFFIGVTTANGTTYSVDRVQPRNDDENGQR